MNNRRARKSAPCYAWLLMIAIMLGGLVADRLLGFSWFSAISDVLDVSQVTFEADIFIVILVVFGVALWLPKANR